MNEITCIVVNGLATDIREISGAYLNHSSPSLSNLIELGRRIYVLSSQVGIITSHWEDDGTNFTQIVDSYKTTEELKAEEDAMVEVNRLKLEADRLKLEEQIEATRLARLNSFTPFIPHAALYKQTLRTLFPEVVEPEKSITYTLVANRLIGITLNPESTLEQKVTGLQMSILLKELFAELSYWNRTDETFTLPWEVVP